MIITGEIKQDKILIKKSKDVGRLYNKSNLGQTTTGNRLYLNLVEGVFLLDEEKIKIFENGTEVDFEYLVKKAAEKIPHFEIKYQIFKDLRRRGLSAKLSDDNKLYDLFVFKKIDDFEKLCLVCAFSERDFFDVITIKKLSKYSYENNAYLWFSLVDEEGDITYYDISIFNILGKIRKHKFANTNGILLENRVIIFDREISAILLEKEFFGKPFSKGLQLSLVEALYLLKEGVINIKPVNSEEKFSAKSLEEYSNKIQPDIISRIFVYNDLKKRGLIVKTGFKFGAHFRAYTDKPNEGHAEYLIHVVKKNFKGMWADISRAVRLAHSVNKDIIFARVDNKNIDYIKIGRLRP